MWDVYNSDCQPLPLRSGHLLSNPHFMNQPWKGKIGQGVQIQMHHWKLHLWGLPSHFSILYLLIPSPCLGGYMIGCKVRVFPLMVYYKWTLLWTSIPMGPRRGLLLEMKRPHFRYSSFTPLVWLGLDLNWKGNLFLGNPLYKDWRTTYVFLALMCKQ
jgi:hypothetical protein